MSDKITVAIVYDFDGTLSPKNMQEYDFIPAVGRKTDEFWRDSTNIAEEQEGDIILGYMYYMLKEAKNRNISLKRESFRDSGSKVELYQGVKEWFARVNAYGREHNVEIEHYINSSGLKEMIEGTSIASEFKKIYACSFFYDVDGVAFWPSVVVNYTTKTQFLFKINKGIESVADIKEVNQYVPENKRRVPFKHMIYIGDGLTDIPCMKLTKMMGGHSIAVFNPENSNPENINSLIKESRVDYVCEANYLPDSKLTQVVHKIIDKIELDDSLNGLREVLETGF
ncbi:MAG: HAD family hydrolase [Rikenellaceae bacterium]